MGPDLGVQSPNRPDSINMSFIQDAPPPYSPTAPSGQQFVEEPQQITTHQDEVPLERQDSAPPPPLPPRHQESEAREQEDSHHQHRQRSETAPPQLPPRPVDQMEPADDAVDEKTEQALYICRVPGSIDVFVTAHKIKSHVVTDFDVNSGEFLMHYEDPTVYAASLENFEFEEAAPKIPIRRKRIQSDASFADSLSMPPPAASLDLPRSSNASSTSLTPDPKERKSFHVQLSNGVELRNNSQIPLVARALIPSNASPMMLIKLDAGGTNHRPVVRMLGSSDTNTTKEVAMSSDDSLSNSEQTGPSVFLDVIDNEYDQYGLDINYIEPSMQKCFTRRMLRSSDAFGGNWFLLSPTQGWFVFESTILRDAVVCYHYLPKSPKDPTTPKVAVSRLTLNLVQKKADRKPFSFHRRLGSSNSASADEASEAHHEDDDSNPHSYPKPRLDRDTLKQEIRNFRHSIQQMPPVRDAIFKRQQSDATIMGATSKRNPAMHVASLRAHLSEVGDRIKQRARADSHPLPQEREIDLSMGQEKLGGGVSGDEAKLGKIVVFEEGERFKDLLVAANLALFNRAYEQVRGQILGDL